MSDILQFVGVDVDPDVHLLVLLLVVNPPGQRSEGKVKADDSVVLPGDWQLHLPAVFLTERCKNYHNVELRCNPPTNIDVLLSDRLRGESVKILDPTWGESSQKECLGQTERSHHCSLIDWTLLTTSLL